MDARHDVTGRRRHGAGLHRQRLRWHPGAGGRRRLRRRADRHRDPRRGRVRRQARHRAWRHPAPGLGEPARLDAARRGRRRPPLRRRRRVRLPPDAGPAPRRGHHDRDLVGGRTRDPARLRRGPGPRPRACRPGAAAADAELVGQPPGARRARCRRPPHPRRAAAGQGHRRRDDGAGGRPHRRHRHHRGRCRPPARAAGEHRGRQGGHGGHDRNPDGDDPGTGGPDLRGGQGGRLRDLPRRLQRGWRRAAGGGRRPGPRGHPGRERRRLGPAVDQRHRRAGPAGAPGPGAGRPVLPAGQRPPGRRLEHQPCRAVGRRLQQPRLLGRRDLDVPGAAGPAPGRGEHRRRLPLPHPRRRAAQRAADRVRRPAPRLGERPHR